MNLRDLNYAVMVAEVRHFGHAAAACHVSQPALSGQIQKLERELGVVLFERTNKSVSVTPVGEAVLAHAREVLDQVHQMEEIARAYLDPFAGPLRLGMIPTIGPYLTPALMPSIRHGMPNLSIGLVEDMTEVLEANLIAGEIDAAILATPVEDKRLDAIPLYEEPFWVAVPHGHPLEAEEEIDVSKIDLAQLLLLADGHCLRDQVLAVCARSTASDTAAVNTQRTSLTTVLALVGAGAGVTLVPAMSLQGGWMTDAGIALRREKTGRACRSVNLTYRRSFPRGEVLSKLADIICAIVPDTVTPQRR